MSPPRRPGSPVERTCAALVERYRARSLGTAGVGASGGEKALLGPKAAQLGAGLLGAVTAAGMTLVLALAAGALALTVGQLSRTSPGGVIEGVGSNLATFSALGALVLSSIVFTAFCCGGYVAARLARDSGSGTALTVWGCALLAPVGVAVPALLTGGRLRHFVSELRPDAAMSTLVLALTAIALLGALLGGRAAGQWQSLVATHP